MELGGFVLGARAQSGGYLRDVTTEDIERATKRAKLGTLHSSTPSASSKQKATTVESVDDDCEDVPNDTLATILSLRSQFKCFDRTGQLPPVVLKSQLYSVLSDRTNADRDLDELRRTNKVRLFKLATGSDDHGILTTDDYRSLVVESPQRVNSKEVDAKRTLEWFGNQVLASCWNVTVTMGQLSDMFSKSQAARSSLPSMDSMISTLLQSGVLCRHTEVDGAYLFCIPSLGPVVRSIVKGRSELIGIFKRRACNDMSDRQLYETIKLRQSVLGVQFHVRDLLGQGVLLQLKTPAGTRFRLARQA